MVKVSVVMITYNHEPFIEKAVLSVLNQEINFDLELIIGEDRSPDNTEQVIRRILDTHPRAHCINYFRNETNLGITPNSKKVLDKIQGEYFATCEGDDFWTDPLKLQKQVDFMDQNPEFAICFHDTRVEYINNEKPAYRLNEGIEKDVFSLDDLISEDEIWFMATTSLLIRRSAFPETPRWYVDSKSGDIPLIMLAARHGQIKYLPDVMAVYQKHDKGTSLTDNTADEGFLRNRIFMYTKLNEETGKVYDRRFKRNIARYYFMMLYAKQNQGKYWKQLGIALKYISLTFPDIPHRGLVVRYHITPPGLMRFYGALRRAFGGNALRQKS